MKAEEEVIKTLEMLKNAGFEPFDAVFKGLIVVMDKDTLHKIQELADKKEAVGSITVFYKTPDGDVRTIEIPIGEIPEEEEK